MAPATSTQRVQPRSAYPWASSAVIASSEGSPTSSPRATRARSQRSVWAGSATHCGSLRHSYILDMRSAYLGGAVRLISMASPAPQLLLTLPQLTDDSLLASARSQLLASVTHQHEPDGSTAYSASASWNSVPLTCNTATSLK